MKRKFKVVASTSHNNSSDTFSSDLYNAIAEVMFNYREYEIDRNSLENEFHNFLDKFYSESNLTRLDMIESICQVHDAGLSRYTEQIEDALNFNSWHPTEYVQESLEAQDTAFITELFNQLRNFAKVDSDVPSDIIYALDIQ